MDRDTLSGCLLDRFKTNRDNRIFNVFYALNVRWVSEYVSRMRGVYSMSCDAFEMTADIFHDMYRYAGSYSFRSGPSFRRWVCVLARNRMLKSLRVINGGPASLSSLPVDPSDQGRGDPLRRMIESEEISILFSSWFLLLRICQKCLDGVPVVERSVLRLREMEGTPYRGIAERLDIPPDKVPALVRKSRRRVARFVQARLDEGN